MANLSAWNYYREITCAQATAAKTNYQVKVSLTSANFTFANAKADGTDIRFTAADGTTLLDFWRESYDNGAQTGVFWVQLPNVSNSATITYRIYYGNSGAADASSVADTFIAGKDFSAGVSSIRGTVSATVANALGNTDGYSNNPIISAGGSGFDVSSVREPGNVVYNSGATASEQYVLMYSGRDASDNTDLGVAFASAADGAYTKHNTTGVIPNGEDPYIARKLDGTLYETAGGYFIGFFERKLAGDANSQPDMGQFRTQDFKTFEVWGSAGWTATVADHVSMFDAAVSGWDSQDTTSPVAIVDDSGVTDILYLLYEGRSSTTAGQVGLAVGDVASDGEVTSLTRLDNSGTNDGLMIALAGSGWNDTSIVPDDITKVGSNWLLIVHGRTSSPTTFRAGVYTTTDAPASWTNASWSEVTGNPFDGGFDTVMFVDDGSGADNLGGRVLTIQNDGTATLQLGDFLAGDVLVGGRLGATKASDLNSDREMPIYVNSDGHLVMRGSSVAGEAHSNVLYTQGLTFTSDVAVHVNKKQTAIVDDEFSMFGIGNGAAGVLSSAGQVAGFVDGYLFYVGDPTDSSGDLRIRTYSSSTLGGTDALGAISAAEANDFAEHVGYLLADSTLAYDLDGTEEATKTDSSHTAKTKNAMLSQGMRATTDSDGALLTAKYIFVRKYDGEDPAQTVSTSEVEVVTTGGNPASRMLVLGGL